MDEKDEEDLSKQPDKNDDLEVAFSFTPHIWSDYLNSTFVGGTGELKLY